MSEVRLDSERIDGYTVLVAEGEFDVYTAAQLRTPLLDAIAGGRPHLILDLSAVTFMDSSALGILVGATIRASKAGGSLRLIGLGRRLTQLFEITGLHHVLDIRASADDAADDSKH